MSKTRFILTPHYSMFKNNLEMYKQNIITHNFFINYYITIKIVEKLKTKNFRRLNQFYILRKKIRSTLRNQIKNFHNSSFKVTLKICSNLRTPYNI